MQEVSFEDCKQFCQRTGLQVPTEGQWEYACRAGTKGPYAGTGDLDEMGWYERTPHASLQPVGRKQSNAFGLYDMHGNVWEWCEDLSDEGFHMNRESSKIGALSSSGAELCVLRGGAFTSKARECRSALRFLGVPSSERSANIGFRPVTALP